VLTPHRLADQRDRGCEHVDDVEIAPELAIQTFSSAKRPAQWRCNLVAALTPAWAVESGRIWW
jgi:hypothetical protein